LAETRRRGWSTRRRGTRTPARFLGRQGARERQQATPAVASPPCASPGGFTAARGRRRRRNPKAVVARVSAAAAHGARAARARVGEVPGWRRALNSSEKGPWHAGHAGREACSCRTRRRRRSPWRGRLGGGDDRWVPSVSLSGERRRRRRPTTAKRAGWAESTCGLAVLLGHWAGRSAELAR
jgi:hypothetical protein